MKKIVYLLALISLLTTNKLFSQSYKLVSDDVSEIKKGYIGLEWYGLDAGFKNLGGAFLFSVGVNTLYPISDDLAIRGSLRVPLLRLAKTGGFAFHVDGGVEFKLSESESKRTETVVLSYRERDVGYTSVLNQQYKVTEATTEYVQFVGTVSKQIKARGGVYLKNTSWEGDSGDNYDEEGIFHKGVYAGLLRETSRFFRVQEEGAPDNFVSAKSMSFYADVLILPTTMMLEDATTETGLLGWRVGMNWNMRPHTKDQNHGYDGGFFGNKTFILELGQRPFEGLFITGSVSFLIRKF